MIKHIVGWSFADGYTDEENREHAAKMKRDLETLEKLVGVIEIKVYTELLPRSTRDIMMQSIFKDEDALAAYKIHPEHKRIMPFIGAVTKDRVAMDFEI